MSNQEWDPAWREAQPGQSGDQELVQQVAWALHCWSCPIYYVNGPEDMGQSDQDHVTESDLGQATFLIGALGLRRDDPVPSVWLPHSPGTACPARSRRGHYLCGSCWGQLPGPSKRALYRRDELASDRLRTLYKLMQDGVPLREVVIT